MLIAQQLSSILDSQALKFVDVAVAVVAITHEFWHDYVHEFSPMVADLAPYFAIVWFSVQIVCKIILTRAALQDAKDEGDD